MLVFALGPSTDVAVIDLPSKRTVELTVEHFQIGGRAVLELVLEPT